MIDTFGPALAGLLPFLLFVFVLLGERFLPIPQRMHPLWIFRRTAAQLARKVHPTTMRARSQQRISGLMATLLLLFLWVGIPAIFYALAELKEWFAAVLLWLALGSQPFLRESSWVDMAITKGHKRLARSRLARWLSRDCGALSPLGLRKATIEYLGRLQTQAWVGVIFWFILAGPIAAMIYRLLFELSRCWNPLAPHWRDFGAVPDAFFRLLHWPPHFISLLLIHAWSIVLKCKPANIPTQLSQSTTLSRQEQQWFKAIAHLTQTHQGGPVMYSGVKVQRPRYSEGHEPNEGSIRQARLTFSLHQLTVGILAAAIVFGLMRF
ncbi:MAG: cobalamin biosynthesis protein [Idiomarina sp.]|nr:cobalamin biosynthesis protein [Idiomarina sp.]